MVKKFIIAGGGGVFEVKVESALVATLLVNGTDPLFPNSYIHELHLETGHEGYLTEDALLISTNPQGEKRKSLWSIKRELAFTEGDIVFADVVRRA